jgi:hypothetical protein
MPLANVFAPMGFLPLDELAVNHVKKRPVAATRSAVGAAASAAIAIGDAYALDAGGFAYHAGADAVVRGICIGFELRPVASIMNGNGPISQDFLPATDSGSLLGVEDGTSTFMCWSDNVVGFVQANADGLFALHDVAPDALFRQSRQYLDVNAGAGTQFRAIDKIDSPADNAYGPACRVMVKLNTPSF